MKGLDKASAAAIERHLRKLTVDIGIRLAGAPTEAQAAEYLAAEFARSGAAVSVETFPVRERAVTREELQVQVGGKWVTFPCSLFSSTPGTEGRRLEAPLCFFESETEYRRKDLSHLRGRAVVHLGCHIESRDNYRRLMAAKPAFMLFVDIRYPGSTPLADGMFPAYTQAFGAVPTVNVAFLDAWRWKVEGATAARLVVDGGMRPATSQNVIAELPGSDPSGGIIFFGGHHDTQANSVGADDNAVGSVTLLEIARLLAPLPRKRTVRLISFGAEEQLSVGSAEYVRRHRGEIAKRGRFMFNLDSMGSHMGATKAFFCGPKQMVDYVVPFFEKAGQYVRPDTEVVPYADHFPFAAAGVPGLFMHRCNCLAGRFFHHRPDDDMTRVSCPLVAELATCAAAVGADLARGGTLPFPKRIPAPQARQIKTFWDDLYGGWEGK